MRNLVIGILTLVLLVGCASPTPTSVPFGPNPPTPTETPTPVKTRAASYPRVGYITPDFTLRDLQGVERSIKDYRGKVVMLNFWASWCGPCRREIPDLVRVYEEYRDRDFVIVAVNVRERRELVSEFAEKQGMSFPILLDARASVAMQYRLRGIPTSLFLDRDGTIRYIHVGTISEEQIRSQIERLF